MMVINWCFQPRFIISFKAAFPPLCDKRLITLDAIYTQGRALPLPFHQYQHLKFIKARGRPPACNFHSP